MYPNKMKLKDANAHVFTEALLRIAEIWDKFRHLTIDEWLKRNSVYV